MKPPLVPPSITNQFIPICKRKKYVRVSVAERLERFLPDQFITRRLDPANLPSNIGTLSRVNLS